MSSLQWFRLYHRIVDDEKLRLLAFEDRWHFVALCCLKADGLLDTPDDSLRSRKIAVKLGVQLRELDEIGRRLQEVGLIDERLSPVAWDELQYRSDNSSERVKKYREKQRGNAAKRECNVSVTAQETDTESDKEEPKGSIAKRANDFPRPDYVEQSLWADFLKNRKAKRAPNTATAHARLLRDISHWSKETGWPPGDVFRECVAKGWAAIYDPRGKENGQSRNDEGGMGVTERAAHRAMSEITGGTGRFESGGGQVSPGDFAGSNRIIDAVPHAVRSIGYAGSG